MTEAAPFTDRDGYATHVFQCTLARKHARTTLTARTVRARGYWEAAEAFARKNRDLLQKGDRIRVAITGETKWWDESRTYRVHFYWGPDCLSLAHVKTERHGRVTHHNRNR